MPITVSALSRFHLFQMCNQLEEKRLLDSIITAYPKHILAKNYEKLFPLSKSLPQYAVLREIIIRLRKNNLNKCSNELQNLMHSSFSNKVSKTTSLETDALIGLSSFMKESIDSIRLKDVAKIVDHGSLHILSERDILLKECKKHNFQPFDNWQHNWMIDRMVYEFEKCDYLFCCSQLAKETLVSYGVKEEKIFSNPLGVDLSRFYIQKHKKSDTFRFLHVSNMSPRKGLHYIIDAFNSLNLTDSELWLVGPLPNDVKLLEKIKSNKKIRAFGSVPENSLVEIYNQCDVFVHPSLADGWAMTILQAMACGLPVIVSNMTGSMEVVTDSTGWIVEAGNTDELADVMHTSYLQDSKLETMGLQANKSILSGYQWSDYGERLFHWLSAKGLK